MYAVKHCYVMSDSDCSVICLDSPQPKDDSTVYGVISFMENKKEVVECIEIGDSDDEPKKRTKPRRAAAKRKMKNEDSNLTNDDLLQPMFAINEPVMESGISEPNFDKSEYPCSYCTKIFYVKNLFMMHELEHFKDKIIKRRKKKEKNRQVCAICSLVFTEKSAYEWHVAECSGKLLAKEENKNRRITRNSNSCTNKRRKR